MIDHNKIIRNAVKTVLEPMGLFQKGQSRVWIDDNGWYFIVAEFQPIGFDKGSYLNVGMHFLWTEHDYLSFDSGNNRNSGFVRFDGDEDKFYSDTLSLAETASEYIRQDRLFKEEDYAREYFLNHPLAIAPVWELYHKMMFCGFTKHPDAITYYNKLLELVTNSRFSFEQEIYLELTEHIKELLNHSDRFCEYVCAKIEKTHAFWRTKPSMKKLKAMRSEVSK